MSSRVQQLEHYVKSIGKYENVACAAGCHQPAEKNGLRLFPPLLPRPSGDVANTRTSAALVEAMAIHAGDAPCGTGLFYRLSPALFHHVLELAALPVDARARCATVSRSWRAALSERSLWTRLDLSASSGVSVGRFITDAVLFGAASRARGELVALNVSGSKSMTQAAFLAVVTANSASLRYLDVRHTLLCLQPEERDFEAVSLFWLNGIKTTLRSAPQLRLFETTNVRCMSMAEGAMVLRNDTPYGPLRLTHLHAISAYTHNEAQAELLELVAALRSSWTHENIQFFELCAAVLETAATVDAVVDAVLARKLPSLFLNCVSLVPDTAAPALARLLTGGTLTELTIVTGGAAAPVDSAGAAMIRDALVAPGCVLQELVLYDAGFYLFSDEIAALHLLDGLTGHPSLRLLWLDKCFGGLPFAALHSVAEALGELVKADSPALQELNFSRNGLGVAALGPLFAALPYNTHLRELTCYLNTDAGAEDGTRTAFARDVLLPAVRANTSLRKLYMGCAEMTEAEELVRQRTEA